MTNETPEERFARYSRHDPVTGCILWTASRSNGYGRFSLNGGHVYAHRFAYERANGPVPAGLELDHLCRVRHCVNPDHLEPVTAKENNHRSLAPSAANWKKTRCKRGHEFTPENTGIQPKGRYCKTCLRDAEERRRRAEGMLPRGTKTHCVNGHEFTEENTYRWPGSGAARICRLCRRDYQRELRRARKAA